MNEYEMMTILHPRLNAEEVTTTVQAIESQITGAGGELLSTDVWGRRRLAYPIRHVTEGTYVLMTFRMEPARTRAVESWLSISESVLRHLLIRGIIPYEGSTRGDLPDQRAARDEGDEAREERADEDTGPVDAGPADAGAAEAPDAGSDELAGVATTADEEPRTPGD